MIPAKRSLPAQDLGGPEPAVEGWRERNLGSSVVRWRVGVLVVILGGCLPASPPTTTATTAPPTTTTTLAPEDALARFAGCLGERGLEVPDLSLDESGRPDLGGLALANDPASPGFRAALNDCAFLLLGSGALALSDSPELLGAVRTQLARFTACMREEEVEGFPDPDPEFDGTGPPYPASAIPGDDPDLAVAIETCGNQLGLAPLTE